MAGASLDYRLYLIVSASVPLGAVEAAVRGGVTLLQYREKELPVPQALEAARRLRALARRLQVGLVVNDRADVALLLEADGLHVGQEDLPPQEARRLLGPGVAVGVSAGTPEEARRAEAAGADYLGVGSVYPSPSKPDAGQPIGPRGLRRVVKATRLPVVAIGGVTAANAAQAIAAGARGVAVISGVLQASDPEAAAAELRGEVDRALQRTKSGIVTFRAAGGTSPPGKTGGQRER